MSSVGSSDGSNSQRNDAEIRKLRDEYRRREAELVKKHARELRGLTAANREEVDRVREVGDKRVADVQVKSQEAITRRDAKYQKEIEGLKKIQTQQLSKMAVENDQKMQRQIEAAEGQVKMANLGKQDRLTELKNRYESGLSSNREQFDHQLSEMREDQGRAMDRQKKTLTQKYEEEKKLSKDYYDDTQLGLKNDLRVTRENARSQLRSQKIHHASTKMRMQDNFMDEIERREVAHNDNRGAIRDGFEASLDELRDNYRKAYEEKDSRAQQNYLDHKDEVDERLAARERRLERHISQLEQRNTRDQMKYQKDARSEVKKWKNQYQDKYEQLEKARIEALNIQNQIKAEDIRRVRKEANEVVNANNRYMRNQMDTSMTKARQALDSQKADFELRSEFHKENATRRVDRILDQTFAKEAKQQEAYLKNVEVLKQGHEDEIRQIRLKTEEEKNEILQAMKIQVQKQQMQSSRTLEETIQKYEKQLADLNGQFTREKRLRANREKYLTESLRKSSEQEKATLQSKYEEKHKATLRQHNQEKEKMMAQHKAQIDNIMSQLRKS